MPGWGAWWSGDGSLIDSPQDSIKERIRLPVPGDKKVDGRVLKRGWDLKGWMDKICHAFEIIRKKGPGDVAAGPYKNRPDFGVGAHYTYHDGPTGETEESWWVDCENFSTGSSTFPTDISRRNKAPRRMANSWK